MSIDPVVNFGKVTVSTGYDAAAVTVVLSTGHGARLPNPSVDGAFNLVWWNFSDYPDPTDDPNREIHRVVAKSVDTLTIVRAQEGTSASTKNTAGKIYKMVLAVTAKTITDLKAAIAAIPASGTWIKDSIANGGMTGAIDGVNLIYQVSQVPIALSGDLMQNGQLLVEGVDYTVNTTLKRITMSTPIPLAAAPFPFVYKYQY